MDKLKISLPIIVEGKYDKIKIDSVADATVITTDGFALFKKTEKTALLRRLASECGVIVLTDPDGGGTQIRSFLSDILPKEKTYHLYIPRIAGKEKRKDKPSRSGTLGVEGMEAELLYSSSPPLRAKPKSSGAAASTSAVYTLTGSRGSRTLPKKGGFCALRSPFPPTLRRTRFFVLSTFCTPKRNTPRS